MDTSACTRETKNKIKLEQSDRKIREIKYSRQKYQFRLYFGLSRVDDDRGATAAVIKKS